MAGENISSRSDWKKRQRKICDSLKLKCWYTSVIHECCGGCGTLFPTSSRLKLCLRIVSLHIVLQPRSWNSSLLVASSAGFKHRKSCSYRGQLRTSFFPVSFLPSKVKIYGNIIQYAGLNMKFQNLINSRRDEHRCKWHSTNRNRSNFL